MVYVLRGSLVALWGLYCCGARAETGAWLGREVGNDPGERSPSGFNSHGQVWRCSKLMADFTEEKN